MIKVEECRSLEGLTRLRPAWHKLLAETSGASFFQSSEWLVAYWPHYGADQQLRLLEVLDDGQPIGIVPLTVRAEKTRAGSLRTLTYPLDDWGAFYGPIGPRPELTLAAALKHIHDAPRDWDLLDLRWVHPQRDGGATPRALESAGFQAYPQVTARAGLVEIRGTWEDYWASRTSHWRNNVRRSERLVAADGEVRHVHYRPHAAADGEADPRWDLYDQCQAIAAASWQGNSQTGTTLSHAAIRDFLRDVHAAAARCGAIDVHLLYLGARPAAFAYNYVYRGYVFGLRMGYDGQASRGGLGHVLLRRVIETCFRCGDHTLDLGINYLEAKRNWLTTVVPVYRYTHFPLRAPRAQLLRLKRIAQRWWSGSALAQGGTPSVPCHSERSEESRPAAVRDSSLRSE
jgi:CelD/BcsL family acetyltransferase involved in cellulose biosynthesis